jgi:Lrp/AsnC family transcriptional regulator, leucine-responsive regulatory protein
MVEDLDSHDKKILFELDINSRASASKIARILRIPKETVNYRIKRLEKSGWIDQLYTIFNPSVLDYTCYRIFLKFNRTTASSEDAIIDFLTNDPSCANLRILEGKFDLVFITFQKNLAELNSFLQKFLVKFGECIFEKNISLILKTIKLNQKFLLEGKTVKKEFSNYSKKMYNLDEIDLGILKSISTKSRARLSDIALDTGVDSRLIDYHLKKLERSGVIVVYTTALNLAKLDREMIQIDIALKEPRTASKIIDFFDSTRTCIFAYELIGKYDLSVEIYVIDDDSLREILGKFKEKFLDEYVYYDIAHVYKKYVINWSPFHV